MSWVGAGPKYYGIGPSSERSGVSALSASGLRPVRRQAVAAWNMGFWHFPHFPLPFLRPDAVAGARLLASHPFRRSFSAAERQTACMLHLSERVPVWDWAPVNASGS